MATTMRMKMKFDISIMVGFCLLDRLFGYVYATDEDDVGMSGILRSLGAG